MRQESGSMFSEELEAALGALDVQIEYQGMNGITEPCCHAVERLVLYGEVITHCVILTRQNMEPHSRTHALLLVGEGMMQPTIVRPGFATRHGGEGHVGLARVLRLLDLQDVVIGEIEVDHAVFQTLEEGHLGKREINELRRSRGVVPPMRWRDYVHSVDRLHPWACLSHTLPLRIIDSRLRDIANAFWEGPDIALLKGHRRLEEIVTRRIAPHLDNQQRARLDKGGGTAAFDLAFSGPDAYLVWPDISSGERDGRAALFRGAVATSRNPRSHREVASSLEDETGEFLMLNQRYRLEAKAVLRERAAV